MERERDPPIRGALIRQKQPCTAWKAPGASPRFPYAMVYILILYNYITIIYLYILSSVFILSLSQRTFLQTRGVPGKKYNKSASPPISLIFQGKRQGTYRPEPRTISPQNRTISQPIRTRVQECLGPRPYMRRIPFTDKVISFKYPASDYPMHTGKSVSRRLRFCCARCSAWA